MVSSDEVQHLWSDLLVVLALTSADSTHNLHEVIMTLGCVWHLDTNVEGSGMEDQW